MGCGELNFYLVRRFLKKMTSTNHIRRGVSSPTKVRRSIHSADHTQLGLSIQICANLFNG